MTITKMTITKILLKMMVIKIDYCKNIIVSKNDYKNYGC